MTDGIERDLRRLDTDRPLSPALYERLEAALLDEADDGALFDALDSPRPIPATTRAGLERELIREPHAGQRRGRVLLAIAAAVLVVAGSVAVVRNGRSGSNQQVAARSPRSVPAPGPPPVLMAPTTIAAPAPAAGASPTNSPTTRHSTTTTTWDCGLCARNGAAPSGAQGAAAGSAGSAGGQPGSAAMAAAPVPAQVSTVEPSSGPRRGGTVVTLTGSGFTGARGVRFGSMSAANFTVVSDAEIRVMAPPSPGPQKVTVSVTYPDGTTTPTSDSGPFFTYT